MISTIQKGTAMEEIKGEAAGEQREAKASVEFWIKVRAQIEESAGAVSGQVVDHFVQEEIDARVSKTIKAVSELKALEGQLRKLRPDQEQYDGEGKLAAAYYSKVRLEERKKVMEKTERIEVALNDVFQKANFDKLKKLNFEGKNDDNG
jgi:hypothetical protein